MCVGFGHVVVTRTNTCAPFRRWSHTFNTSNLGKRRIFLKKNMSLAHAVDMDIKHMYALVCGTYTMDKQTFPHVLKWCIRRHTYVCAWQHSIYIRKRTLTHVQKRCLRWNTQRIKLKTHISACSKTKFAPKYVCFRKPTYHINRKMNINAGSKLMFAFKYFAYKPKNKH